MTTRRNSFDLITAACRPLHRKVKTPPPPSLPIAASALEARVCPVDTDLFSLISQSRTEFRTWMIPPAGSTIPSSRSATETKPALSIAESRECRLSVLDIPKPRASAAIAIAPASPTQPAERKLALDSIMFQKRRQVSCLLSSEPTNDSGSKFSPAAITICSSNLRATSEDRIIASVKICLRIVTPVKRRPSFIVPDSVDSTIGSSPLILPKFCGADFAHSVLIRRVRQ
mmetsp:Transcript_14917/g.41487  ORF Transcript_14917/g.41487 Transcript_14917/m.41487 type:complete len:229 (-) Transcript_14917:9543-10229(-)